MTEQGYSHEVEIRMGSALSEGIRIDKDGQLWRKIERRYHPPPVTKLVPSQRPNPYHMEITLLEAALIINSTGWTSAALAMNGDGEACSPSDEDAIEFSIAGALWSVSERRWRDYATVWQGALNAVAELVRGLYPNLADPDADDFAWIKAWETSDLVMHSREGAMRFVRDAAWQVAETTSTKGL